MEKKTFFNFSSKGLGLGALLLILVVAAAALVPMLLPSGEAQAAVTAKERYVRALALAEHYAAYPASRGLEPGPADENGQYLCAHFKSLEELRAATLECFTDDYAQGFFSLLETAYEQREDGLWLDPLKLFDVTPWQEGVADPEALTVWRAEQERIVFYMPCADLKTPIGWFVLEKIGADWRFSHAYEEDNPLPDPESEQAKVETLLAALPEPGGPAWHDRLLGQSWTGLAGGGGTTVTTWSFSTEAPDVNAVLLGLTDNATGQSIGTPVLVRANVDQYQMYAGQSNAAFFLFAHTEGGVSEGGLLTCDADGWRWVWPCAPGTEEYGSFWSGVTGRADPEDATIELRFDGDDIPGNFATHFFYETIYGESPSAVRQGAGTYAESLGYQTSVLMSLEPKERVYLATAPDAHLLLDVYELAWRAGPQDVAPENWEQQEPAYLVFSRGAEGGSGYEYLGGAALTDCGGVVSNAAIMAVYGLGDLEYSFFSSSENAHGYYGLGSETIGFMDGEPVATRHDDWEPVYSEGSYWEELDWPGLNVVRYVDAEAGHSLINMLTTTLPELCTFRGLGMGASRAEVLHAYPEAEPGPFWGIEGDFLWWNGKSPEGFGPSLLFWFENDSVSKIEMINMFD